MYSRLDGGVGYQPFAIMLPWLSELLACSTIPTGIDDVASFVSSLTLFSFRG
jgi:hypothetical protein